METNTVEQQYHIILFYKRKTLSSLSGFVSVTLTEIIVLLCQIHIFPPLIYNFLTNRSTEDASDAVLCSALNHQQ